MISENTVSTYPGPEVYQKYYVITMMKLIRSW